MIPPGAEAEWVSYRGEVKEVGVYLGAVAAPGRQATLLPGPHRLRSLGRPDPTPGPVGRYFYEPDGAVIRAHLFGELADQLGARTVDSTIAYLTADHLTATPFASAYEISDVLPFNVKRLRALVAKRGYGTLVIKKRGADVDPAALRKLLRPVGSNSAVLIITRVPGGHLALIGQPVRQQTPDEST
jgi:hypothetical protein